MSNSRYRSRRRLDVETAASQNVSTSHRQRHGRGRGRESSDFRLVLSSRNAVGTGHGGSSVSRYVSSSNVPEYNASTSI